MSNKIKSWPFFKGFEYAFDLYPKIDLPERFGNVYSNSFELDEIALRNDWNTIENDIDQVLKNFKYDIE